jgi:glycine/D-amino acid oxidase-like deaminating enzyme
MVGADAPAGTYSAPELVLCPSAWTNQMLLPFGIQLELKQRDPAEADARRE